MYKRSGVPIAAALALGASVGSALIEPSDAFAQASSTAGALRGVLKDKAANNDVAVGATVVATSPALVTEQVVITDDNGQYFISSLPPGVYTLTIYYNDTQYQRGNVLIQVGKEVVVNVTVDSAAGKGGETIVLKGTPPIIDQGSTKTGMTITDDYTRNVPTGRTFAGVLGSAAGSQPDLYGTSIAGTTSAENIYVVEGINTTDTGFGGISSNLPNEFIQETEVITGGYNAEFGRATGGIINVVTKQGSNEFKGSVYGYFQPGALYSAAQRVQREGSSIATETNVNYQYDFGAELGGPILKDKLWFHVGLNPSLFGQTITRTVQSSVDQNGDRIADKDANGLTIREKLASSDNQTATQTYFYTAKINGAINQNNQFQVSAFGNPTTGTLPLSSNRNPTDKAVNLDGGAYDLAGKFTSKFNEGKTQIDAVVGFHRQFNNITFGSDSENVPLARYNYTRSLYDFASVEGDQTVAKCQDNVPGDAYPGIINCPVLRYASQGVGQLEQRTNDRTSGVLSITQRVKAAGYHTFKAGVDAELATYDSHKALSGGAFMQRAANVAATGAPGRWQVQQFLRVKKSLTKDEQMNPDAVPLEPDEFLCVNRRAICSVNVDGYAPDTNNSNVAAFIQDSWQVRPNLTLNAGLRWENQTGYVAKALQGTITPEGETVPDTAYELKNLLSPRIGFIYDPTSEGKAKVFGHWGRFYEAVPMDLNVRAFGGEINRVSNFNQNRRLPDQQGYDPNCDVDFTPGDSDLSKRVLQCPDRTTVTTLGEGLEYVTPGLKGQYTQELIAGAEYEFIPDLKFGVNYIHRTLPVVIEDFSTDGGNTYLIGNPGEDFSGEATKLRERANEEMMKGDMALASVYNERADNLDFIGKFDKPQRNYDALQVTATQRPTKHSLLLASYTYSVAKGNIAGLFSTETGQLDPNITSLYDLPDLMANRFGNSGLDRPHNLKIDGFYQFDLKKAGLMTVGASFRALSGLPHNALGAHPVYLQGESYLLPRAAIPRGPVTTNTDIQVSYGRRLGKTTTLEGFFRVFNLFDEQDEAGVDEIYTVDNAMPIVGGQLSDLKHVKTIDGGTGLEVNKTATPNKNFDHLNARNGARNLQLGFRLTF